MKKTYKKKGAPSPTECKTCGYDSFERPMGGLMKNRKGTKFYDAVYKPRELEAAQGGLIDFYKNGGFSG